MKEKTTITIYKENLSVWKEWLKIKEMNSAEFIEALMVHVKHHKQKELYNSLSMPHNFHKTLEGIKITKNYKKN